MSGDQCFDCGGWFDELDLVDGVCPECRANNVDFGDDPDEVVGIEFDVSDDPDRDLGEGRDTQCSECFGWFADDELDADYLCEDCAADACRGCVS